MLKTFEYAMGNLAYKFWKFGVIKKIIQETTFVIFALLLKDAIFGYWPLPRFSLIPSTDLKDGSCNFMVSKVSSTVPFFSI